MKHISTDAAPAAIGPYSQAVSLPTSHLVFTSGQLPIDPATSAFVPGGIAEQTTQALKNLQAVLHASDSSLGHIVKTTVFLKDMNDFAAMNAVYATFFPHDPPARSTVEVARLPKDALVEVEAIATTR
jgi:2-iminobutanoate/2-iminopropanoate deaminase